MQKVKELTHFGIHESGQNIFATFSTEGGEVSLLFDVHKLTTVLSDLSGALASPQVASNPATVGVVPAGTPRRTRVELADAGSAVILSFQMPTGLEHHFSLPPTDAVAFGRKIVHKVTQKRPPSRGAH